MTSFQRHTWMWAEACAVLAQAERRQQQFMELLSLPASQPVWEPPADVLIADGEIHIVVALPGADNEHVVVQVADGQIEVEARVPPPPGLGPRSRVLRLEIPYGVMRRRIALPAGRYAVIENRLSGGCLHLRLQEVAP